MTGTCDSRRVIINAQLLSGMRVVSCAGLMNMSSRIGAGDQTSRQSTERCDEGRAAGNKERQPRTIAREY